MYAFAPERLIFPIGLNLEDTLNIQQLYGGTLAATTTRPSSVTTPATRENDDNDDDNDEADVCALRRINVLVIINKQIFIASGRRVWSIDMNGKSYQKSILIKGYLKFLLENLTTFSAAYQKPSGYIVLFADNRRSFTDFGLPTNAKIKAAINTYRGQSFVIYNVVGEIDDCATTRIVRHNLQTIFPGLPQDISSAFRYVDGHLYFFGKKQYNRYNEFNESIV
ncbi:uncharacterized protein LOC116846189 [Odontomachus brunneus]|uniref:uncharacterized protein LOC116846189 n=1 Tax=Odontomachus brunneus TaxID=486640 RepID=UPI0013F2A5F7|nr:uncharacterized protein LOC116846189 [Odontomachus brunneus]